MTYLDLFPTQIYLNSIEEELLKNALDLLNELKLNNNTNLWADNNTIVTNDQIFKNKKIINLINKINLMKEEYCLESIGIDPDDLQLSSMWITSHINYSYHSTHIHPNSFISGVLYLAVSPEISDTTPIVFEDPRKLKSTQFADYEYLSWMSEGKYNIYPQNGLIILFPSWLEHTVPFSEIKTYDRTVLSFNYSLIRCKNSNSMRFGIYDE